jgi:hypothetical protein
MDVNFRLNEIQNDLRLLVAGMMSEGFAPVVIIGLLEVEQDRVLRACNLYEAEQKRTRETLDALKKAG